MCRVYTYALFSYLAVTALVADVAVAEDARAELAGWIKSAGGNVEELAAWPELEIASNSYTPSLSR